MGAGVVVDGGAATGIACVPSAKTFEASTLCTPNQDTAIPTRVAAAHASARNKVRLIGWLR